MTNESLSVEAIDRIVELAEERKPVVEILDVDELMAPRQRLVVTRTRDASGNTILVNKEDLFLPPPHRTHRAFSIASLIYAGCTLPLSEESQRTIWHSPDEIVVCLDDCERSDFVKMKLTKDPRFDAILSLRTSPAAEAKGFAQKDLRKFLLTKIGRGIITPQSVFPAIEQIKWQSSGNSESNINQTAVGMGKQLSAIVSSATDIPDVITVVLPVYSQIPDYPVRVDLLLEVDPFEQKFYLLPAPGSIESAINETHDRIEEAIDNCLHRFLGKDPENNYRVFYGAYV